MAEKTIKVKVTPGAKTEGVERLDEASYKVRVRPKAEDGKANARVLEVLAEYFDVAKSRVVLVRGASYREKLIRIICEDEGR